MQSDSEQIADLIDAYVDKHCGERHVRDINWRKKAAQCLRDGRVELTAKGIPNKIIDAVIAYHEPSESWQALKAKHSK